MKEAHVELQHWGWNPITIGFVGTIVFIIPRAWGYWHQAKRIWSERSGKSISNPAFIYIAGASCAAVTYGVAIQSIALMVSGATTMLLLLPILVGLWRFNGFDWKDRALCMVLTALVVGMIIFPVKDWFFMASMLGMVISSWLIPWEIFRNRDAGVVEVRMLIAGFCNSTFWLIYAFAIGDWVLQLINPIFLTSIIVTFVLWWRYRREEIPQKVVEP